MNCLRRTVFATILLSVASMPNAEEPAHPDGSITLAIGGDLIGPSHPMNRLRDPEFAKVADLFRNADVGFANQEGAIFDLWSFAGHAAAENGGGEPVQPPSYAREVRDMGISLVSKANNHTTDWGTEGLLETLENLDRAGVVWAGAGPSASAARGPGYLATRNGLVALVATASTFPPMSVAGDPVVRKNITTRPRPGISALHAHEVRLLPPALFASLRKAAGPFAISEGGAIRISDQLFAQDKSIGTRWEMQRSDEDAILGAIDEARTRASLVLFSIHAHETAGDDDKPPPVPFEPMVLHKADEAPSPNDPRPASFEVELFHAVVDHGADVVMRHGPHVISGIEIYKGKPIFYGLGSLFLDFGGRRILHTPIGEELIVPDSWDESFVPVCVFKAHRLEMIKLYPIEIEPGAGDRSGVPGIAANEHGRAILERLKELSAAYGTKIEISEGVGLVRLPPS
jgi:poly-gamma-glutamate synthesis protein (capsule biosynthesis protein)